MFAIPRLGVAILLLAVGVAIAFAAGFAYGEVAFPTDAPVVLSVDGVSISMLTGSYVSR